MLQLCSNTNFSVTDSHSVLFAAALILAFLCMCVKGWEVPEQSHTAKTNLTQMEIEISLF